MRYVLGFFWGAATAFIIWAAFAPKPEAVRPPLLVRAAATPSPRPTALPFGLVMRRAKAICQDLGLRFVSYNAERPYRASYVSCQDESERGTYIDLPPEVFRP